MCIGSFGLARYVYRCSSSADVIDDFVIRIG